MSNGQNIATKIDTLINTVQSMPETNNEEKETEKQIPTKPEQPASEYDLSKPYRIVVKEDNHGGAEKLRIENFDVDKLELKENEILIDVRASGINFIDTYHRSGLYPGVHKIGKEGSGLIQKIGGKVENYKIGDKVCWYSIQGSYATHVVTTNNNMSLMKIPESFFKSYENENEVYNIAASIGIQALTAHYLCRSLYTVNDKSSVLIHAGAGGTGGLLIQICKKILKAPLVITTVGSDEKKKIATEYGADHVILYKKENFVEAVSKITNKGVDVVFDGVGASTYDGSLKCTTQRGTCVFFGNASGPVPPINPLRLTKEGSVFITRPTLAHYIRNAEELKFRYDELFKWMQQKSVNITVGQTFKLNDVFSAHIALESRKTIGKILLKK